MRILYGINGTGQGHIIKSINIIYELKKLGHGVDILLSGTNHQIDLPYDIRYKFHGVSFDYTKDGSVDWLKTASNLSPKQFLKDIKLDVQSYDRVVTDFDPISAWACKISKKDSVGVSHQYSFLSNNIPRPKFKSFIGELVINKLSPVTKPLGLHFEKYDDFIDYPVIRGDVKVLSPMNKNYYTVYLPSYNISVLVDTLSKYNKRFQIFTKDIKNPVKYKNIKIFPNSKSKFIDSFIDCKGIITSGGFETPSEALFLKKQILSIPIKGQYEQLCNSEALKKLGVFISKDISNIDYFFETNNIIDYRWIDPMPRIIKTILE
jgi:uncharacterized protein (TIGR00661 family)